MAPSRRLRFALTERAVTAFAGSRPIRVLDAGTGDGLLSLALAKRHPDWTIVGFDLRENLLDGARRRARARGLGNVTFETADLTRPLPGDDFDVVLAIECLAEVSDDQAALSMMSAALIPEGLLLAHVPDRHWKPVLPGSDPIWRDEIRHGYTPAGLTAMLRTAGLEEIRVSPSFHALVVVAQEIRDRIKESSLIVRLIAFPALAAPVRLERWGLRPGDARGMLAEARKPAG